MIGRPGSRIEYFSTCPPSTSVEREAYADTVIRIAQWSEAYGCAGILVYTDHSLVDPWLLAHLIAQHTARLVPLVAVQPVYMHPYTVAKMVASFGHLHDRRVFLNMVAGGFTNDLRAMEDTTAHDDRYARLIEYTTIVQRLLAGAGPVTHAGRFYRVTQLKLAPAASRELPSRVFLSGSSPAGLEAARALGATAVRYPEPDDGNPGVDAGADLDVGIRMGIIARPTAEEAWDVAHRRFPEDRTGQLTHQLAMKVSDSSWHAKLASLAGAAHDVYWLTPFTNYKTFCPYLVGDYDRVAAELARYMATGHTAFITDVPASEEDLFHTRITFDQALHLSAALKPAAGLT